jgi:hypothetical protein
MILNGKIIQISPVRLAVPIMEDEGSDLKDEEPNERSLFVDQF